MPGLEGLQGDLVVDDHLDRHRHLKTAPGCLGGDDGPVPGDDPLVLQPFDPPEARSRRESHSLRELGVAQPPVPGQLVDDCPVDVIEFPDLAHDGSMRP